MVNIHKYFVNLNICLYLIHIICQWNKVLIYLIKSGVLRQKLVPSMENY
jgi:hypothetical protein